MENNNNENKKINSEYVGVDEKFIPEEEKYQQSQYVEDSMLGNKEQTKQTVKKVAKVAGIAYLIYGGIILLVVIGIFVFVISIIGNGVNNMNGAVDTNKEIVDGAQDIIDDTQDKIEDEEDNNNIVDENDNNNSNDNNNDLSINQFNDQFNMYNGTVDGITVSSLLTTILSSNTINQDNQITVNLDGSEATDITGISSLIGNVDMTANYTVTYGYDKDGYINKIEITK